MTNDDFLAMLDDPALDLPEVDFDLPELDSDLPELDCFEFGDLFE